MKEASNGSDFIIITSIKDEDGVPIPYLEVDWELQYYTFPGVVYKASCKDGILSSNCSIVDGKIEIYVNKFSWGRAGTIRRKVQVSFSDSRFMDGRFDYNSPESLTEIKIV